MGWFPHPLDVVGCYVRHITSGHHPRDAFCATAYCLIVRRDLLCEEPTRRC